MRVSLTMQFHPDGLQAAFHSQFGAKLLQRETRIIAHELIESLAMLVALQAFTPYFVSLRLKRSEVMPLIFQLLHHLATDRKPGSNFRHALIAFWNGSQDPFSQIHTQCSRLCTSLSEKYPVYRRGLNRPISIRKML
ncbi:hypothetical protein SAMN06265222_101870 [Neorhodopirellula lusitana]|uniref:Transposase n=1 Tax=Neorhodopirellula lusitana TaxID=445327 RepID=A0ABY1PQT6_9BACT|nr:hypothetical protein SAMN06265222_101870 [Neorhodopirellula lusitana]